MPLRKKKTQDRWLVLIVMLSLVPLFQNMSPFEKSALSESHLKPRRARIIEDRRQMMKTQTPPVLMEILNFHLEEDGKVNLLVSPKNPKNALLN